MNPWLYLRNREVRGRNFYMSFISGLFWSGYSTIPNNTFGGTLLKRTTKNNKAVLLATVLDMVKTRSLHVH